MTLAEFQGSPVHPPQEGERVAESCLGSHPWPRCQKCWGSGPPPTDRPGGSRLSQSVVKRPHPSVFLRCRRRLYLPGSQSLMEPLGRQWEGPWGPPRHGRQKTPGDLTQGRLAVNQDSRPGPSLRSHQGTMYPTSSFFPLAKCGPWSNQPAPVCVKWQRTDVLWSPLDKEAGRKEGHPGPCRGWNWPV